jgi:phage FluMu protein gp41
MVNALDLLHKYAVTFRKMIQVKVLGGKISVKRLLKLNSDSDFDFLIAAMDIIDDASAAISHVERFGLSGATKYDDFGEGTFDSTVC